jgi:hypothetical protein
MGFRNGNSGQQRGFYFQIVPVEKKVPDGFYDFRPAPQRASFFRQAFDIHVACQV